MLGRFIKKQTSLYFSKKVDEPKATGRSSTTLSCPQELERSLGPFSRRFPDYTPVVAAEAISPE